MLQHFSIYTSEEGIGFKLIGLSDQGEILSNIGDYIAKWNTKHWAEKTRYENDHHHFYISDPSHVYLKGA